MMEPDGVPYDLSGTTVTAITINAYQKAIAFRECLQYRSRKVV
jgi:hypothetical protein